MTIHTSACEWQAPRENPTHDVGTATAISWREEGYSKYYLFFHAWMVSALVRWAQLGPTAGSRGTFLAYSPSGHEPFSLFWLASSYPFLKKAIDITSLRGNHAGADGKTYYLEWQGPDWCDRAIKALRRRLRNGTYTPGSLLRLRIKCGDKTRLLAIPTLIDRVVERTILLVLSPIYEVLFHSHSFGFRYGVSTVHALQKLDAMCRGMGSVVVGKLDLKNAFDRIPHRHLIETLRRQIRDEALLRLIISFIQRPDWVNLRGQSHVGLPQGGPLSGLLFNIYMDWFFDQVLAREYPQVRFIRWADDILILANSQAELGQCRDICRQVLRAAGLEVNEEKSARESATAILRAGQQLEYLGFMVGLDKKGAFRLRMSDDAWWRLLHQLNLHISGQRPNVTWEGLRRFQHDQLTYTIRSWLEAYAGAVPPDEWPDCRKVLKSIFLGGASSFPGLEGLSCIPTEHCPTTEELDAIYKESRDRWTARFQTPLLPADQRLLFTSQRNATANTNVRTKVPDFIADGADLVPAPLAFIEPYGSRKPGAEVVEMRVRFTPLDPSANPVGPQY